MESRSIGFRVSPNEVFYAIIENKEDAYEFISKFKDGFNYRY